MKCCFCGKKITLLESNNPAPVKTRGRCCNECNYSVVIPARIYQLADEMKAINKEA